MNATALVIAVLWLEGAVLLVALVTILGYAFVSQRRARRREARLAPARALLSRHLEDRSLSAVEMSELRRLSPPDVIRLFFAVAPSVGMVERAWLRDVAEKLGLVANARERTAAEEWWNRLSGARFLALVGAEPAVMERLSHDEYHDVRAAAAMFLAQYPTATAVDTLIAMLDDAFAVVRFAAKDALIRLGATATPTVALRLGDADERHAYPLLQIACAAPSHAYSASVTLRLRDPQPGIRRLVARLCRGMGGAFAIDRLTEMLDDEDDSVREAAVEALGFLNHWPASGKVAARLEDNASRVRLAAALALDRFGAPGELFLRRALTRGTAVAIAAAQRILDDPARSPRSSAMGVAHR